MYEKFGNIKTIRGIKYYIKTVKPKHFMVKYHGFGISTYVLNELLVHEVKKIVFVYEGTIQKVYVCDLDKFIGSDKRHIFLEDDEQKFVSIKDMEDESV